VRPQIIKNDNEILLAINKFCIKKLSSIYKETNAHKYLLNIKGNFSACEMFETYYVNEVKQIIVMENDILTFHLPGHRLH
jgi:hypothetical protein